MVNSVPLAAIYNLIKISPFMSLSVCFCHSWKDLTQPRSRHVLVTYWPVIDWSIRRSLVNTSVHLGSEWTECVVSTTIRYTHFHWLIYKLKRSWQEVTRTCLKRGCVRSFHERQKQTESEMKGLILIRLQHLMQSSGKQFWNTDLFAANLLQICSKLAAHFSFW